MMPACSNCGRAVVVICKRRKKSSRETHKRKPRKINGHDLCHKCFCAEMDRNRLKGHP